MYRLITILTILATVGQADTYRSLGTAYEPISTTAIPVSATPTVSIATFTSESQLYRFVSTVDTNLSFGPSPTATASSTFLPAYSVEVWPIRDNTKVSARSSTAGTLYIDRLAK